MQNWYLRNQLTRTFFTQEDDSLASSGETAEVLGDDCSADSRNAIAVKRMTLRRDSYTRELVNGKGLSPNYIYITLEIESTNIIQSKPVLYCLHLFGCGCGCGWGGIRAN